MPAGLCRADRLEGLSSFLDTPPWALDVAADGSTVYVADFDGGLIVLR